MKNNLMRVCYFGTYRAEYSRNVIMMEGLRRAGVEVVECHERLWHGIEDRIQAVHGGWSRPGFWWRALQVYMRLLRKYFRVGDYDVLIVGYPGQLDVFIARLLSWLRRKPLVWDIFMSIYLIALERNLDQENRLAVGILRALERNACSLPNLLIIDTSEYAKWFQITHGISKDRLRLVPTGADDRVFHPANDYAKRGQLLRVVYYGTFIPNHGVPYIMDAARLLANSQDIKFVLIGQGPDREFAIAYKVKHDLNNVQFIDWLDKESLVKHMAKADISLGAFGTTPQSLMTVQNKIYEGMAMGKAVVTGDSPAVRQVFEHCTHLYLCERANPEALAQAILALYKNPDLLSKLGIEGHNLYGKQYTLEKLGALFFDHLASLVSSNP